MTLSERRTNAANRLRLVGHQAPAHDHGERCASDDAFSRGFHSRGNLESWNRDKMRRFDEGFEAKRQLLRANPMVRVAWGRTRYAVAHEKGSLDRLAAAIEKMPARYFETPFEILAPGDS